MVKYDKSVLNQQLASPTEKLKHAVARFTDVNNLALHKHILAVLKVTTNADTTIENAYTVKSA